MEDALRQWLLDNRPYTHMNTRIKQFALYCLTLEPTLTYGKILRHIRKTAQTLLNGEVGRLWQRDRAFERVLRLYGQNDQRTAQWHSKRGEMITASEVYKVFSTDAARREIMLRKLAPPSNSQQCHATALIWGTRMEPIAKKLYEEDTNCTILDVSCATHPRYSFLGASPDGLIVPNDTADIFRYGRLVEFKCPISRAPSDEIPIAYWHQMQMQMECTEIDECEYVEFRFAQVNYSQWNQFTGKKGSFAVYEDGRCDYTLTESTGDDCQIVYWILNSMKKEFVKKDSAWLTDHLKQLKDFWKEIQTHKEAGTMPAEPPPKFTLTFDL